MTGTTRPTRPPLLQRLLDGGRTWGALEVSSSRYGVTRYRLVVFPPGIARDERMLLRLWRAFPAWGIATWLVLEIALMTAVGPDVTLMISTGLCLSAGAVLMALTGHTRGRVRTVTVLRMIGVNDADTVDRLNELRSLAEGLVAADAKLAAGALSTVEHEAEVWRTYDRMPIT